jgi:hypothetical protein
MERTIVAGLRDGFMVKEESNGLNVYYNSKYIFSKLKRRIENEEANKKIKIQEPIKIELEVIDLGKIE